MQNNVLLKKATISQNGKILTKIKSSYFLPFCLLWVFINCHERNLFTRVFANTVARHSFYKLFYSIHLADNSKTHSKDSYNYKKLYKINDFLCLLKRNFQQNYSLESCVSIDETIIKYNRRSSIK